MRSIRSVARQGGHARAKKLTRKRRRQIAVKAARVRWAKRRNDHAKKKGAAAARNRKTRR